MKTRRLAIPDEVRELAAGMFSNGADYDILLAGMRRAGLPKISSIRLLADVAHISLKEAKEKVHFSSVWKDRIASDDTFHNVVFEAARQIDLEPSRVHSTKRQEVKMRA